MRRKNARQNYPKQFQKMSFLCSGSAQKINLVAKKNVEKILEFF